MAKKKPDKGPYRGFYEALPDDADFQDFSPVARALFYPLRLKLGVAGINVFYTDSLPRLTGFTLAQTDAAMDELERADWIRRERNVVWIRNAVRHDPMEPLSSPNGRTAIEHFLLSLPKLKIVNAFALYYGLRCPYNLPDPGAPAGATPKEAPTEAPPEGGAEAPTAGDTVARKTEEGIRKTEDGREKTPPAAASLSRVPACDPPTREAAAAAAEELTPQERMQADLEAWLPVVLGQDDVARRRFAAAARPIVEGSDQQAWTDPRGDGGGVPWEDRPALLQLALVKCEAEQKFGANDLHRAVRYVCLQQRGPKLGGNGNGRQQENETPGAERSGERGSAHNLRPITEGGRPAGNAKLEREEAESRAVAAWLGEHPGEKADLEARVATELQAVPGARDLPAWIVQGRATSRLRELVLARLGETSGA